MPAQHCLTVGSAAAYLSAQANSVRHCRTPRLSPTACTGGVGPRFRAGQMQTVNDETARAWVRESLRLIELNKDYLTSLDSAIGDADHGVNLTRGFAAVVETLDKKATASPGDVLVAVGSTLISTVGGASGPLYGSAF